MRQACVWRLCRRCAGRQSAPGYGGARVTARTNIFQRSLRPCLCGPSYQHRPIVYQSQHRLRFTALIASRSSVFWFLIAANRLHQAVTANHRLNSSPLAATWRSRETVRICSAAPGDAPSRGGPKTRTGKRHSHSCLEASNMLSRCAQQGRDRSPTLSATVPIITNRFLNRPEGHNR